MPPSWHPVPVCVPQLRCRRAVLRRNNDCCRRNYFLLQQRKLESEAGRCRGRDRCHSGGFLLRIMPPSWHPVPACTPRLRCRRTVLRCSSDDAAAISKSGPEIKNRCILWVVLESFLASIRKFGPEIKNRCSLWVVLEGFLAAIRKSGPEIKNQCSSLAVLEGFLAAIAKFDP